MNSSYNYRNLTTLSLNNDDFSEDYDYYAPESAQRYEHEQSSGYDSFTDSCLPTGCLMNIRLE